MKKKLDLRTKNFITRLVMIKDEAGRLGLYATMHEIDKAVKKSDGNCPANPNSRIRMSDCSFKCGGFCCRSFSLPFSLMELKHQAKRVEMGKFSKWSPASDLPKLADMLIVVRGPDHFGTPEYKGRGIKKPKFHNSRRWQDRPFWIYTCKHLNATTGECMNYDNRPTVCRRYPDGGTCYYKGCKMPKPKPLNPEAEPGKSVFLKKKRGTDATTHDGRRVYRPNNPSESPVRSSVLDQAPADHAGEGFKNPQPNP